MILRRLERGLFVCGVMALAWCAGRLVESWYTAQLPVPSAIVAAATLPGGEGVPAAVRTATGNPDTMAGTAAISNRAPAGASRPAPGSWVAKLDAPSVKLSATVLEGSDDGTLALGAGHIEETPLPGQPGNVGIAGHRDTTFRVVRNLHAGDRIDLTTRDRVYRYFISRTFIVNPEDVYVLQPGDRPMLTLVTCYPFEFIGHAPRRYIIQAVLADQAPRTSSSARSSSP